MPPGAVADGAKVGEALTAHHVEDVAPHAHVRRGLVAHPERAALLRIALVLRLGHREGPRSPVLGVGRAAPIDRQGDLPTGRKRGHVVRKGPGPGAARPYEQTHCRNRAREDQAPWKFH